VPILRRYRCDLIAWLIAWAFSTFASAALRTWQRGAPDEGRFGPIFETAAAGLAAMAAALLLPVAYYTPSPDGAGLAGHLAIGAAGGALYGLSVGRCRRRASR
jgi:hypothetical protein